jgi:hypothetical protein
MKTTLWTTKSEISGIIEQRLKLQSTQKALENLDCNIPDIHSIKSVLRSYRQWDEKKQRKFVSLLGGPANFKKTEEFIKEL